MLLALVFGVVLVLVGVTASALVAVTSNHLANATLGGVVKRDASLIELFVNGTLLAGDVDEDGPTAARRAQLTTELAALSDRDGIVRIEIRDLSGRVIVGNDPSLAGEETGVTAAALEAADGRPAADLIEAGRPLQAAGALENRDGNGRGVPADHRRAGPTAGGRRLVAKRE